MTGTVASMIKESFQEMKKRKAIPPKTMIIWRKNSAMVVRKTSWIWVISEATREVSSPTFWRLKKSMGI